MVRFALIGCGKIGKVHADSIAAHPRAEPGCRWEPRKEGDLRRGDGAAAGPVVAVSYCRQVDTTPVFSAALVRAASRAPRGWCTACSAGGTGKSPSPRQARAANRL